MALLCTLLACPATGARAMGVGSDQILVNQAPVITTTPSSPATADVQYVYDADATDPDGPSQTWSFQTASHTCGGSIAAATGVFTFTPAGPTPPQPSCVISIKVCDGALQELCGFQTFTIQLVGSNVAPVITSSPNVSVPENQTAAITVTSNDPDGGPPVYSLIGGSDFPSFSIGSGTGVLTFVTAPDFEIPGDANANNVYEITVQVSDGAGGTAMQAIGVTVTNANDAPVITSSDFASVAENQTAVLTVTSVDPDGGAPTYSRVGGVDVAKFAIGSTNGVLTFVVPPDFEVPTDVGGDNLYELTVQVSDGNGGSATQQIVVQVTDVNESAGPTNLSAAESYTEDTPRNLVDIVIPGAASATVTLRLSDVAAGALTTATSGSVTSTFNTGTGTWTASGPVANVNTLLAGVTYNPAANFNASFNIVTQVTNGGPAFNGSKPMTGIAVNDPPTSAAPAARSGSEDATMTFTAGNALSAADVDGGNLLLTLAATNGTLTLGTTAGLTFSVGDGTADPTMTFSATQVNLNTALATLTYGPTADFHGSANLTFTTSDGVAAALVRTIALTVTPVADIVNDAVTTLEDTVASFNVITGTGGASADNFEGTPSVTAVTQGTNGGVSSMGNGALMYSPAANFNGPDSFTYTVTSGGATEVGTVSVSVTAVNDAPTLNAIPDPMPIPVNAGLRTVNLSGIGVGPGDPAQTLTVTAVSNNVALIPNPAVTYTSPNATGSLSFTPVAGQQGSALITVTVTDSGGTANGGVDTSARSFTQLVVNGTIFLNGFE